MTDELLAYLLDDLPPRRREEVELMIQTDPQWRREYERLRECFDAAEQQFDQDCVDQPPAGLADRTCELVDSGEYEALGLCGGAAMSDDVAPARSRRSRWSMADVTIGAGVLLVLFGLLSPALLNSRDISRADYCNNNMRQLVTWMIADADRQGGFLPPVQVDEPMGKMAWSLSANSGISLQEAYSTFFCPNSSLADDIAEGKVKLRIVGWPEVRNADGESRRFVIYFLGQMYAFQAGQLDKLGSIRPKRLTLSTRKPIASHAPALTDGGRMQVAIGRCRQQMIFEDCHVGVYRPIGAMEGDDPFLNYNGEHAASDRENDVTLLRGNVTPIGAIQEFPVAGPPNDEAFEVLLPENSPR